MFFSGPSLTPSLPLPKCLSPSLFLSHPLSMCQHLQARPFVTGGAGGTAEEEDVCVTVSDPIAKLCGRKEKRNHCPSTSIWIGDKDVSTLWQRCSQYSTEAQK